MDRRRRAIHVRTLALVGVLLASWALVNAAQAQLVTVQLNDPIVVGAGTSPHFVISADGARVVYLSDQDTEAMWELYSVPTGGGTSVKLNGPLVAEGDVGRPDLIGSPFAISPDGARVVYIADQDVDEVYELYSVPIGGGTAVKLNGPLVAGGDVGSDDPSFVSFAISADSGRVVYRADQEADGVAELYSVPIGGGTAVKLNSPLVTGGNVWDYGISPDATRVVYQANQEAVTNLQLYSVPIGGGTVTKLNGPLIAAGCVWEFVVSPDSTRVVYRADEGTDGADALYSVPVAGGTVVKLNGALVTGGDVYHGFRVSPDGARVVYRADQETDGVDELYSVPIAGGTAVKLNRALVSGGDVRPDFAISPDGSRVVYRADQDADGVDELYSVSIEGGTRVKLNDPLPIDGDVHRFAISPDGATVVYRADQDTDEMWELYSVPIEGGTSLELSNALVGGWGPERDVAADFAISDNGATVVYRAEYRPPNAPGDPGDVDELYSVPIGGGTPIRLISLIVRDRTITKFAISPDSTCVVYRADQVFEDLYELYGVSIDGGHAVRLNGGAFVAGGLVNDFAISPNSTTVVYRGLRDAAVYALFSVPSGGGTPVKLNGPLAGNVDSFAVSPDNRRVIYRAPQDTATQKELYSVPIGGGTPVKLNGPLASGAKGIIFWTDGQVWEFAIAPDSTRVVYIATQDSRLYHELYSVPITGGEPVQLNASLVFGGDVRTFAISTDSARVVYLADQETDGVYELYSVSIGGGTPARLNGALAPDSAVSGFAVSADGAHVVYLARQAADPATSLYSVPNGGATPVRLNGPFIAGGYIQDFAVSPDSSRVVYRGIQETDGVVEIYSVAIGGGAPVKLNSPIVAWGDVHAFAISPNSARVVYRADQDLSGVYELYSVPIGGGTPVKLNGPLVAGGSVGEDEYASDAFAISLDGARVVYRADQDSNDVWELYSVPITGGTAVKLNGPLVAGGDVGGDGDVYHCFDISPDSARVVYLADQEISQVFELYSVSIEGGTPRKLHRDLRWSEDVQSGFRVSDDSSHTVFRISDAVTDESNLYSTFEDELASCHTLSASVVPAGAGTIVLDPPPNCGNDGYMAGTEVTLTAASASGYTFDHWTGAVSGIGNPTVHTVTQDATVVAHFTGDHRVLLPCVLRD